MPLTLLCIATYRKGDEFLKECRRQGCRVLLLTEEKLRDSDWPRDSIDAFYYVRRDMPARPTISSTLAPAKPSAANTPAAASSRR